jgi:hypothetical protein
MNWKLPARLIIDLAMTILLICAFAYRIIGDTAHEWIGISVFGLFILHNILNRQWYENIFKGIYTLRRITMAVVNIVLVFTMTTVLISGLLQSRTVLAFLHLPGGMALRLVHTTAAYWGFIIIAVHLGLHWGMIINGIKNMFGIGSKNHIRTIILRVLALLTVSYGVWASFDRDMFSKLFLGFSFDYWPPERPWVLFFTSNVSIMGVYVCMTYYGLKLFAHLSGEKSRIKDKG